MNVDYEGYSFRHVRIMVVFYLKVNREEKYTIRNVMKWIYAIQFIDQSRIIIVCDKQAIIDDINHACKKCGYTTQIEWLSAAEVNHDLISLVKSITSSEWHNAGIAHLMTFWHAKKNGIKEFWNIDGDDTCICLDPQRCAELLVEVMKRSILSNWEISSLDMHYSRYYGKNWTFGVTYINSERDWLNELKSICVGDERFKYFYNCFLKAGRGVGIDQCFGYLKEIGHFKIGTWCCENLRFIHYSNDFFKRPIDSGFYHWKNGRLQFPILLGCFNCDRKGNIPIANDVDIIDMSVTDEETTRFLIDDSFNCSKLNADGSFLDNGFFGNIYRLIQNGE